MRDLTNISCNDVFPEGFSPRDNQSKCINETIKYFNGGGKFVIINAPTGSGKTHIAAALSNLTDKPTSEYVDGVLSYKVYDPDSGFDFSNHRSGCMVLTTTKTLQDQYTNTFGNGYALKGKTNYQCTEDPEAAVDYAPCVLTPSMKYKCWNCNSCPYYHSRNNVLVNKLSFLNYSAFFHLQDNVKSRNIIVCDEASELEDELVKSYSVSVVYKHLHTIGLNVDKLQTDEQAKGWLTDIENSCSNIYKSFMESFSGKKKISTSEMIKLRYVSQLVLSLGRVLSMWGDIEYVIERDDKSVQIIPLRVDKLASNIFDYADKVVLMSATIIDHPNYAKSLGIKDYKYIEVDSTFDPKKSPIYCSDRYPLTYKTMQMNLPKVIDMAKTITNKHSNEKGIIHTYTFAITEKLKQVLLGRRFLYREDGSSNESILLEHSNRSDATVLISPSMAFGVDLKDDAARWQIIMKMPYPSLASKRIKTLAEQDSRWYIRKMLTTFIQMCGRSTRSEDDHSVTYVLDGGVVNIIHRNRELLPKYFLLRFV